MDYINLDFCIIENPLDKSKRPIIFVTRKGRQYLDETVVDEDDYEKAIYIIKNIGYVESDILTFEFSQDPGFPSIAVAEIKKTLENNGMQYSEELEKTMKSEFELLNLNGAKQLLEDLNSDNLRPILTPELLFKLKKDSVYKIPIIGEKLTLYFYLFIECKFSGNKCYLNLNGDFTSNKNDSLRNYIVPFKCDFIRINNNYNPNKIILKSCLTNASILKKLPMEEKKLAQIGVAKFRKDKCIVFTEEKDCGACSEHCPTQAVHMIDYKDGLTIPEVTQDLCTGCGACESICPSKPYVAIYVEGVSTQLKAKKPTDAKKFDKKIDDFGF